MKPRSLIPVLVICAGLFIAASFAGVTFCYFAANATSGANAATAWTSATWTETTTADFNAGLPLQVNTTGDQVTLARTASGPYVYALRGGGQTAFWRYDVAANTWSVMSPVPAGIGAGGALAYTGGDFIYALRGGGTRDFYRYSIAANTWSAMTLTPSAIGAGGALAFDGTYVYALRGGDYSNFWRYSIAANSWTSQDDLPGTAEAGAVLAYAGADKIYGARGGNRAAFYEYEIATDRWRNKPVANPGNGYEPGDGAALAALGTRVYLHSGVDKNGARNRFSIYTIATDLWVHYTTPFLAGAGGALASDSSAYLYALQGGSATGFWRYTTGGATWAALASTPGTVGAGGSLAFVAGAGAGCYASPGSVASVVFDTTTANSRWDMLAWNASVPSGTAIAVQVRSSNTPFLKDAATPGWTTVTGSLVGGEYVVSYPNLPSGRYHQWRANLSSTLCPATPTLHDATVYFSDWATPIFGMGSLAYLADTARSGFAAAVGGTFVEIPSGPAPSVLPEQTVVPTPIATANATPTPSQGANATVTPVPVATTTTANVTTAAVANVTVNATTAPVEIRGATNATPTPTEPAPTTTEAPVRTATAVPTANASPAAVANVTVNATTVPVGAGITTATTTHDTQTPLSTPVPMPALPALMAGAAADRNLTIFVDLARLAGLDRVLDDPGPCTVFVPTDDAFKALPPGYLAGLRADPAALARVLSRHVAEGTFGAAELAGMRTVRTLDGADVDVTGRDGVLQVGNATVNYTAARASNGVLHAIDAVILPVAVPTSSPTTEATVPVPVVTPGTVATGTTVVTTAPATPLETIATRETTVAARATTPWAKHRPETAG